MRGALDLRGAVKDVVHNEIAMLNIIANNINKMQNDLDTMAGESAKYKLYFFVGGAVRAQERS